MMPCPCYPTLTEGELGKYSFMWNDLLIHVMFSVDNRCTLTPSIFMGIRIQESREILAFQEFVFIKAASRFHGDIVL